MPLRFCIALRDVSGLPNYDTYSAGKAGSTHVDIRRQFGVAGFLHLAG